MNEVANITKLETMMMQLVEMQKESMKDVKVIDSKVDNIDRRVTDLENNYEITTQQRGNIKKTVSKQVYKLLGLPNKTSEWTEEHRLIREKYSNIFHRRCYTEASRKGHLAYPYGTTTVQNYVDAIKDIEAWTPSNGIAGLMREADENAKARLIAKAQGY